MLKLYYAPRTRSVRIRWLLEELEIPHEPERVEFRPQASAFAQATPLGKFPVLSDGETAIGESGAIMQYVLEPYGNGRLAPPSSAPAPTESATAPKSGTGTDFLAMLSATRMVGDGKSVPVPDFGDLSRAS